MSEWKRAENIFAKSKNWQMNSLELFRLFNNEHKNIIDRIKNYVDCL